MLGVTRICCGKPCLPSKSSTCASKAVIIWASGARTDGSHSWLVWASGRGSDGFERGWATPQAGVRARACRCRPSVAIASVLPLACSRSGSRTTCSGSLRRRMRAMIRNTPHPTPLLGWWCPTSPSRVGHSHPFTGRVLHSAHGCIAAVEVSVGMAARRRVSPAPCHYPERRGHDPEQRSDHRNAVIPGRAPPSYWA
jgi:hypothetical protein